MKKIIKILKKTANIFEKQTPPTKNWKIFEKQAPPSTKNFEKTGSAHQKTLNFPRQLSNQKMKKHQKIGSGQPDGVAGLEKFFLGKKRR
jgi:hypothetical protein